MKTMLLQVFLLLLTPWSCRSAITPAPPRPINPQEKDSLFWHSLANEELQRTLNAQPEVGVAKNVILFLGDGMGMSTVTASRILSGQMQGHNGEESTLSFDNFPYVGLSRTYSVDHTTTDSAASGTGYLCGVKTNTGTIGVNAKVIVNNCTSQADGANDVTSILRWSLDAGKAAGVVTTTRVTHATPAATYSHTAQRDWEGDADMEGVGGGCVDIALQLVQDNSDINVVMGGGRYYFLPNTVPDPEHGINATMKKGRRDGKNLIDMWLEKKRQAGVSAKYVWNETDFQAVDPATTDNLLGLFEPGHMHYELERTQDKAGEPSLEDMTAKAIQILKRKDKGFFLLVEGGRIDHGHHETRATMALHDTVMFAKAVAKAVELTSVQDTLIVVTADHSHSFVLGGYSTRGNPILGLENGKFLAGDKLPFVPLQYGNGPGFSIENGTRVNLTGVNTTGNDFRQPAAIPMSSETHGGEDVAIYARGPMAHLYVGVHQQNYIPHVMAYASCVGSYSSDTSCVKGRIPTTSAPGTNTNSASRLNGSWQGGLLCLVLILVLSRVFVWREL